MSPAQLNDMIVKDLMSRWPQTMAVFLRRRMACPGCLMAPFMTVSEAAAEHGIAADELARDLLHVMEERA